MCPHPLSRVATLAIFFLAATILSTYPLSLRPGGEALDLGPDTRLFLWTLGWDTHALTHRPLSLFDANIFHPEKNTLAYSEHQLGSALFAAPVIATSGNLLLGMNAVLLLSCVASGLGTYYLARQVGVGAFGALTAGLVFAFTPPRLFRLSQLHLATVQWTPFCLALLHRYAASGGRRHLLGAVALFTLQAWSSGQTGLFLAVAAAGLVSYLAVMGELSPESSFRRDFPLAFALALSLNLPFLLPYLEVRNELGLERSLHEASEWSPNVESYLASPAHLHRLASRALGWERHLRREAKAYLFPGLIPLSLAAIALSRSTRKKRERSEARAENKAPRLLDGLIVAAALGALAIEAAGGARIAIGGARISASGGERALLAALLLLSIRLAVYGRKPFAYAAGLRWWRDRAREWLGDRMGAHAGFYLLLALLSFWASLGPKAGLYAALYRLLPGFDFIRVPSRLTLLTVLALAVLAGAGISRLRARRPAAAWGLGILLLAELAAFPLETRAYPLQVSPMDRWLSERPGDEAIVALPVPDPRDAVRSARWHSSYMLDSTAHFRPLVNGYSGFLPSRHDRLFRSLIRFPDETTLAELERLGVRYAIVHRDGYHDSEWKELAARIRNFDARLKLLASFDEGQVYQLVTRDRPGRETSPAW